MPNRIPPDLFTLVTMLLLSAVSGVVSITQRIASGRPATVIWVISEFLAAILAGYLATETYPYLHDYLPEFVRMSTFVSICAYSGGSLMRFAETTLYSQLPGGKR